MLRNFLITAIRNFRRQPGYTLLNILGLTLGMAATLFILLYLTDELAYDRYHERADRIFRVSAAITEPDDAFKWAVTQVPLAPTLKEEYAEVEEYVRFLPNDRTRLEYDNRHFFVDDLYLVDSTVFEIFSFELLEGDPARALARPDCIVLSQTLARRIFGAQPALGQFLRNDEGDRYEITGVYRDMPQQSHLIADALLSSNTIRDLQDAGNWGGFGIYTYVLLRPHTDPAAFERNLQKIIDTHVATIFDQFNIRVRYELVPLTDIHLKSDFQGEPEPVGKMAFIYIFTMFSLLMIAIACLGLFGLASFTAEQRTKEIGIRKVVGAGTVGLIALLTRDYFWLIVLATIPAFVAAWYAMSRWLDTFTYHTTINYWLFPLALLVTLLLALLTTGYHALRAARRNPVEALRYE